MNIKNIANSLPFSRPVFFFQDSFESWNWGRNKQNQATHILTQILTKVVIEWLHISILKSNDVSTFTIEWNCLNTQVNIRCGSRLFGTVSFQRYQPKEVLLLQSIDQVQRY